MWLTGRLCGEPGLTGTLGGVQLRENLLHDPRSSQDLGIRDRWAAVFGDRAIQAANQEFHAVAPLKIRLNELQYVSQRGSGKLLRISPLRQKVFQIAFVERSPALAQRLLLIVQDQTVLGAVQAQHVQSRAHL